MEWARAILVYGFLFSMFVLPYVLGIAGATDGWLMLLPALAFAIFFAVFIWRENRGVAIFLAVIFALIGFATIMGS